MDETMKRLLCSPLLLMLLLVGAVQAHAQTLADPTQPPPESRLLPQSEAPAVPRGPQLQSVLIGSRGREVAVIDGQTIRKGEKFNGAVLVEVRKNQVVLQNGRNRQVLTLFPEPAQK
ncbi:MSHA biogenesis protein MshK [Duganella sp. CF402]|nr:MSHA biogenesis protein MshK [Duganella sp. BK701]SEK96505.1 MSHA biogenesis protein MshK [Duganella sp. CF402]